MEYHFKGGIRLMDKEKMQDIKERLDLFPSNMNEPAQKAYCELFDYINHLEQQCKKQKEVIDKINLIIKGVACGGNEDYYMEKFSKINELIKEVSE